MICPQCKSKLDKNNSLTWIRKGLPKPYPKYYYTCHKCKDKALSLHLYFVFTKNKVYYYDEGKWIFFKKVDDREKVEFT